MSTSCIPDARPSWYCIPVAIPLHVVHSRYDPRKLDDPELRHGKHQTVLQFLSYRTSITLYTNPDDVKKDINSQFRERFPHLQLTLTKLRSLKRDITSVICTQLGFDPHIAAFAHVYFERVVLRGFVRKENRRVVAAACALVAIKYLLDGLRLDPVWDAMSEVWGLVKTQVPECVVRVILSSL